MAVKLVGNPQSTCTRRVLMVLEETVTPYEIETINFVAGEHKTPEYKEKHHPFARIPALHDGDFHVFESRAIIKYIADQYDKTGKLNPSDAKKRAIVEQWISVEQSYFNAAEKLVAELLVKPVLKKLPTDEVVVAAEDVRLHEVLAVMNKRLGESKYLAGEDFTLADIDFMPYTGYLLNLSQYTNVLDKYENVARWWKDISSRPTWQKVLSLAKDFK